MLWMVYLERLIIQETGVLLRARHLLVAIIPRFLIVSSSLAHSSYRVREGKRKNEQKSLQQLKTWNITESNGPNAEKLSEPLDDSVPNQCRTRYSTVISWLLSEKHQTPIL